MNGKPGPRDGKFRRATYGGLVRSVVIASLLADASAETAVSPEPAGPFLAVPNLVGWPNLVMLPDGTLLATLYNHPSHATAEGSMDLWASVDGGVKWEFRGRPGPHDPNTLRNHQAVGQASDGALVVLTTGWSNEYPAGASGPPFRAFVLSPWVSRSTDDGRTWEIDRSEAAVAPAPVPGSRVVFGPIQAGADGHLRAAIYTHHLSGSRSLIYRSKDEGRTWGEPVVVDDRSGLNETALRHVGEGVWLAAARRADGGGLQVYRSNDDAMTWENLGLVTGEQQHPGDLLKLSDGRVLLAYGNRSTDPRRVEAMVSGDLGKTWSAPATLATWSGDGGYPASRQRADGKVVTLYYGQAAPHHTGYHVGVVIWSPTEVFPMTGEPE